MAVENLHKARKVKDDEFYTKLSDIEQELKNYKDYFVGKIVYCNCDNYLKSKFWEYFSTHFQELKLKRLIATYFDDSKTPMKAEMFYVDCVKCIEVVELSGNGDFRNQESIDILKKCDVVVTNPPFSLFREYIAQLMQYKKNFLVVGSMNAITYKEIFPLLKDNKIWLGCTYPKEFIQPNGKLKKFGNINWYTNIDTHKRHEMLSLSKRYSAEEYPMYDNYNAINVDKISDIPEDYNGIMGVPITFLEKYCPEQFEILGQTSGRSEFDKVVWPTKHYENAKQVNADKTVVNGSKINTRAALIINGNDDYNKTYYTADNANHRLKIVYARILIRRKY